MEQENTPVLPDVGSITTLLPGMSLPSRSAASTMAFAMRSLTDPPADMNSTLPTTKAMRKFSVRRARDGVLTEVASETICLRDLVEADEGRVADAAEGVVEDLGAHFAAGRGR